MRFYRVNTFSIDTHGQLYAKPAVHSSLFHKLNPFEAEPLKEHFIPQ